MGGAARRLRAYSARRFVGRAVLLSAAVLFVAPATPASAHTPHDDIVDVVASPDFARNHLLFAISNNRALRSTDLGQHWTEMARGLTGKTLARFAFARSDPRVVYLSSRGGGVYRSDDDGLTWNATNMPRRMANVAAIAVAPTSDKIVVVADGLFGGLYRTIDSGRTWTVASASAKVDALTYVADRPHRIVAGDASGAFLVSDDDGAHFRTARGNAGSAVTAITAGAGSIVFAGTKNGEVLRSDDDGDAWSPVGTGIRDEQINGLLISPRFADDHTVWASAWHTGAYRSTNGASTWSADRDGLTTDSQADTIKSPQFRGLALATDASGDETLFLGGYDGLFASDNRGTRWKPVETQSEYVTGLAVSPNYASDGTVVVNTYVKGVYISRDDGRRFVASDTGLEHAISAGNKLLPVRRMHNVVFSPAYATDHTIFTATWDRFIISHDGGATWRSVLVAAVPQTEDLRQFVIAVSPNYARDRTMFLGTRQGDVYRSTRGGEQGTWTTAANVGAPVRSFAMSPAFEKDHTLFASTEQGVLRSTDAGTTWKPTGPEGISLLAISPNYPSDRTLFAGTAQGVYVTRNGAASWSAVSLGLPPSAKVAAIAVSPDFAADRTMLVSVAGVGLFRSSDAGASFRETGRDLTDQGLVIADFDNPTSEPIQFSSAFAHDRTVYAYAQQSVVRSTDAGATWELLSIPSAADFSAKTSAPSSSSSSSTRWIVVAMAVAIAAAVVVAVGWLVRRRTTHTSAPADER
jgi:photosystem II stability/assembly factor-like uncharacterized protein